MHSLDAFKGHHATRKAITRQDTGHQLRRHGALDSVWQAALAGRSQGACDGAFAIASITDLCDLLVPRIMKFTPQAESLIASLRDVPGVRTTARLRDIIPLDNAVEVILEKYKIGRVSIEDSIMAQWRDIVGEQTAHRCCPNKIIDGRCLIIITSNATLRQELLFRKAEILRKLRQIPQCENLRELLIRAG